MRHVIIGNGPAGVVAAETIRKHRAHDEIVLIGEEPEEPYSRMAIPYLLIGNIAESGTWLRKDANHWKTLGVKRITGEVTSIATSPKRVALDDGQTFDFDTCLIATGSSPIKPKIPGIDSPFVHPCWTLKDARNIMQLARSGARVLQMGAGFIGCIIMEALAARGVDLTVVEMGDRMVPRMMGPTAGTLIRKWCEQKGVTVYTGTKVEAIEPTREISARAGSKLDRVIDRVADVVRAAVGADHAVRVRFSDGRTEEYDLVIQATGVRPNVGFLSGSGIKCLAGVLVDERMQTSVPGIYAAGDCAEAFDAASRQDGRLGHPAQCGRPGLRGGDQHGRRQRGLQGRHPDQRPRHAGPGLDLVRAVAGRGGRPARGTRRRRELPLPAGSSSTATGSSEPTAWA